MTIWVALNFEFLGVFDIFQCNIKIKAFWYRPKLISRKIRVEGNLLDLHCMEYPQSKFPIGLPSSAKWYKFTKKLQIRKKIHHFQYGQLVSHVFNHFHVKLNLFRVLCKIWRPKCTFFKFLAGFRQWNIRKSKTQNNFWKKNFYHQITFIPRWRWKIWFSRQKNCNLLGRHVWYYILR